MKRIILGIVCILLNGFANASGHYENFDIVGYLSGASVCFNNDGAIASLGECNSSSVDEGYVRVNANWTGGSSSGINGCGTDAVAHVTSATCPFIKTSFATCTNNVHVLVQTTKSGHYWDVKANSNCDAIADLTPCLKSDSFDEATGCTQTAGKTAFGVDGGYIKLSLHYGGGPPNLHCADSSHYGRMSVDPVNEGLYICTQSGWKTFIAVY